MTKAAELAKMGEVLTNSQIGGRRNIVINGAMQVAQRSTSETDVFDSNKYETLDRYYILGNGAGRATMTQTADGPSGFANCLKLACTTTDTSIAAGEFGIIQMNFEGQDLQQIKKGTSDAEKVTVSFYVKANASATYSVELEDKDNSRYNSQEFSVTTDWTRVIKTFSADTTGAFDDDNGGSLGLNFWLHAGSNFTGGTHTDDVWHTTTNQRAGDNQTSFFDSTDRTFFITGLQMEVGSQATPFEHRSFGEELLLCQRYYEKTDNIAYHVLTRYAGDAGGRLGNWQMKNVMRADPTCSTAGTFTSSGGFTGTPLFITIESDNVGLHHSGTHAVNTSSYLNGGNLIFDAEL